MRATKVQPEDADVEALLLELYRDDVVALRRDLDGAAQLRQIIPEIAWTATPASVHYEVVKYFSRKGLQAQLGRLLLEHFASRKEDVERVFGGQVATLSPLEPPSIQELEEPGFLQAQVEGIASARTHVDLLLHTVLLSSMGDRPRKINEALRDRRRDVAVRVLAGKREASLAGAFELNRLPNVEVRLHPELIYNDFRYVAIDREYAVVGVSPSQRGQEEHKQSTYFATIRSREHAQALLLRFNHWWASAHPPMNYLLESPFLNGDRPAMRIASELGIDEDVVLRAQEEQQRQLVTGAQQSNKVVVFYGTSASGKSTLMQYLNHFMGLRGLDLMELIRPRMMERPVPSDPKSHETYWRELIGDVYRVLRDEWRHHRHQMIEIAPDCPNHVFMDLLVAIEEEGFDPALVKLECDDDTLEQRQQQRERPVDRWTLQRQKEERRNEDAIPKIASWKRLETHEIRTDMDIEDTVEALMSWLPEFFHEEA